MPLSWNSSILLKNLIGLYQCDAKVKLKPPHTYSTLVQPTLQYANVLRDPYQQYLINSIEMIQQRTARWVKQEYNIATSVIVILNNLEWSLLSKRWQYSGLTLFFKYLHQDPPGRPVIRIPQLAFSALHIDSLHTAHSPSTLHLTIHIYNIPPSKRVSSPGQLASYWLK